MLTVGLEKTIKKIVVPLSSRKNRKMKKIKILVIAFLLPVFAFSQGVEIVPFAGYMFGGSIKFYEGKLKVKDGMDYGISVLVPVKPLLDVELNYSRLDSKATWTPYTQYASSYPKAEANLATNYFQLGIISKFYKSEGKVEPFGSFSLGATWFDPSGSDTLTNTEYSDSWAFSITAGLGVKIMFSERIGIILRGRLMMPMHFAGSSFYVGTGGSGLSLNSVVSPFQGDFNGGLIVKVGN